MTCDCCTYCTIERTKKGITAMIEIAMQTLWNLLVNMQKDDICSSCQYYKYCGTMISNSRLVNAGVCKITK